MTRARFVALIFVLALGVLFVFRVVNEELLDTVSPYQYFYIYIAETFIAFVILCYLIVKRCDFTGAPNYLVFLVIPPYLVDAYVKYFLTFEPGTNKQIDGLYFVVINISLLALIVAIVALIILGQRDETNTSEVGP